MKVEVVMSKVPYSIKNGDEIRIISPSLSPLFISEDNLSCSVNTLLNMGFKVSWGKNSRLTPNIFLSSSVDARVDDLHEAFADQNVKAIIMSNGGFNSNSILDYINWDVIKQNPKIVCGFSDITVILNAIYSQTDLITYHGPTLRDFSRTNNESTLNAFNIFFRKKSLVTMTSPQKISFDKWKSSQNNIGLKILNEGKASGVALGGNLSSFRLLYGTKYMPSLKNSILFIEEDSYTKNIDCLEFDRNLQSLVQQNDFNLVKGVVFGKFEKSFKMTNKMLKAIILSKKEFKDMPIIFNADIGHTLPRTIFPIGAETYITAR